MIHVRTRLSRYFGLYFGASVVAALSFAILLVVNPSWPFAIPFVASAAIVWRLARLRSAAQESFRVVEAAASAPVARGVVVAPATHRRGWTERDGHLVIAESIAGFVPSGGYRHLAFELAVGLFGSRVVLATEDLAFAESPTLQEEIARLIEQRGGFVLDDQWRWGAARIPYRGMTTMMQRGEDHLTVTGVPRADAMARWAKLDARSAKRALLWIPFGLGVMCIAAGLIAYRVTGDSEYPVAGASYGGIFWLATAIAWWMSRGSRHAH